MREGIGIVEIKYLHNTADVETAWTWTNMELSRGSILNK